MKQKTKYILGIIATILVAFFAIPYQAYQQYKKEEEEKYQNIQTFIAINRDKRPEWQKYLSYCLFYWSELIKKVLPQKVDKVEEPTNQTINPIWENAIES